MEEAEVEPDCREHANHGQGDTSCDCDDRSTFHADLLDGDLLDGTKPRSTNGPAVGKELANTHGDQRRMRHRVVVRLLMIEDDATIAEPLADGLRRAGFDIVTAATATEGLRLADDADLVLLDLGLPDLDGSEVCRRIRERSMTPIIVVTARGDEIDRVLLLESGADDYVVKPFGTRELIARIRAVARRTIAEAQSEAPVTIGPLLVDVAAHRAEISGATLDLTPKEFDLLAYLVTDVDHVHRRRDILEAVWDEHWYGPTKTLDVHVASLRRKLGDPNWITTVRGVGYRFGPPS